MKIMVLVWLSNADNIYIMAGAADFARESGWPALTVKPLDLFRTLTAEQQFRELSGADGVIAVGQGGIKPDVFPRLPCPLVSVTHVPVGAPCSCVLIDFKQTIGVIAAHFADQGAASVCYVRTNNFWAKDDSFALLRRAVRPTGIRTVQLLQTRAGSSALSVVDRWIERAPGPTALVVPGESLAQQIRQRHAALVPERLVFAVISNNSAFADAGAMTHVVTDCRMVGRVAAAALARHARTQRPQTVLVPPGQLVVCASSNRLAKVSPMVNQALVFIEQHGASSITAATVAEEVGTSIRTLDRLFEATMHRSTHAEIVRFRVERAKFLLTTSAIPIKNVGIQSGYPRMDNFSRFFRQHTGVSPRVYRRAHQEAGASNR
jgi:LacI family transcriptional regulator